MEGPSRFRVREIAPKGPLFLPNLDDLAQPTVPQNRRVRVYVALFPKPCPECHDCAVSFSVKPLSSNVRMMSRACASL